MRKIVEFFQGVRLEMSKVTWPNKQEVISHTTLVIVFALVLSLVVFGFDSVVRIIVTL